MTRPFRVRRVRARHAGAAAHRRRGAGRAQRALPRRARAAGARLRQARAEGPVPRRSLARRAGHRRSADPMHQDPSAQARRRRQPAALHRNGAQTRLPLHRAGRGGRGARLAVVRRPGADAQHWREFVSLLSAGIAGGGVAGIVGGLVYGFAAASSPCSPGPARSRCCWCFFA